MPESPAFLNPDSLHHSSLVMLLLLIGFAVLHSGGAALRQHAERIVGARIWRLLFAGLKGSLWRLVAPARKGPKVL